MKAPENLAIEASEMRVPLQPKQKRLLRLVEESIATWIGFGGSRGGAKSHVARAIQIIRRLKYPRTDGLIFRRKWKQIQRNHLDPLFRQYPFMRRWYNTQEHKIKLPNGSGILFGVAENPGDIDDYQGEQYMDICVDEGTHLTQQELEKLKACCRWPNTPDHMCKFVMTMNPGNVGHKFVKRVFMDKQYHENEIPGNYVFLQAYAWDNVEWARSALAQANLSDRDYYSWSDAERFKFFIEKTQYGRELSALPQALRVGWLLGNWDQFAGQYFDCFDVTRHTRAPQEIELKPWWPRWISCDWGYEHPAAVYWHARDGDRVITYDELHSSHMGETELGERIVAISNRYKDSTGKPIRIQDVFIDQYALAKRTSQNTIAEEIGDVLDANGLPRPSLADDDRVGGARLCYEMLKADLALISTACPKLIECLPTLSHDEDNIEDVLKVDDDDPYDAWRYGLKSMLSPARAPLEERVRVRLEERIGKPIEDVPPAQRTWTMIQLHEIMEQERRRDMPIRFARHRRPRH